LIEGELKTLSGLPDFFSRDVRGGGYQRVRVFSQLIHIISDCLGWFVHKVVDRWIETKTQGRKKVDKPTNTMVPSKSPPPNKKMRA
jgi:hypothetical protein